MVARLALLKVWVGRERQRQAPENITRRRDESHIHAPQINGPSSVAIADWRAKALVFCDAAILRGGVAVSGLHRPPELRSHVLPPSRRPLGILVELGDISRCRRLLQTGAVESSPGIPSLRHSRIGDGVTSLWRSRLHAGITD